MARAFALAFAVAIPAQNFSQSKSANSGAAETKQAEPAETIYRNSSIGFRYHIPFGWVDRTEEMQEDRTGDKSESGLPASPNQGESGRSLKSHSQVLLAVFEHPPEATTKDINSAVVIASESTASYPGLNTAEDYVNQLTEIVTSKGFKLERAPYGVDEDSRHLVRADFTKTLATQTGNDSLVMRQSTLILLTKNQIVSFTFIAAQEGELDELTDGLEFNISAHSSKPPTH